RGRSELETSLVYSFQECEVRASCGQAFRPGDDWGINEVANYEGNVAVVKTLYLFLAQAVSVGDTLVLAQVFEPARDHKALHDEARHLGVDEDISAEGAVAFADGLEAVKGAGELRRSSGVDPVFDQDHHRSSTCSVVA